MKPPILFKKEEFTYFSKNDNFSINEDWRNTLLVWHTLKQEIIAEQFWLCRKDYASRLLGGFVPLSLHTVGHLHVRNLRGKGLGRVILLGGNCSTEPPEATEPQIHVFNETSKERWWHPECPAEYSVKLESTVCINSFFFSFEWNWVRNWPRIPQACWSTRLQQMYLFILVQSLYLIALEEGECFYFVFINKHVQIWVLEIIL